MSLFNYFAEISRSVNIINKIFEFLPSFDKCVFIICNANHFANSEPDGRIKYYFDIMLNLITLARY